MTRSALYLATIIALSFSTAAVARSLPLLEQSVDQQDDASRDSASEAQRYKDAFQQPLAKLDLSERLSFQLGKSLFNKIWVSSPSSTTASDGLGPLFNARNCSSCHINNGRGQPTPSNEPPKNNISSVLRFSIPARTAADRELINSGRLASLDEPTYGGQLQDMSIQGIPAEGVFSTHFTRQIFRFPDGESVELQKPSYQLHRLAYGALEPNTQLSLRIAPALPGLGLLAQIPDEEIEAFADPYDLNQDGISGKPNYVWDLKQQSKTLGRFGWKAKHPSLEQQNAQALSQDIGLSSAFFTAGFGGCTQAQTLCRNAPNGNSTQHDGLEVSHEMFAMLNLYTHNLAMPAARNTDQPRYQQGEKLFQQSGCAQCHRPSYFLPRSDQSASSEKISPYSDLLLHDMGEELADSVSEFLASGNEWRTTPLWGIGLAQKINPNARFLHDGRARTLAEAILWHGGEAETAKQAFIQLNQQQRQTLIFFLESI